MELECPVVRDLYTLYKENELSAEVRNAVLNHLEECTCCRKLYDTGEGFPDILSKEDEVPIPRKLDEKMMLKLKISRLKTAVIFIAVLFLIFIYSGYVQSRNNLLYDASQAEQTLYKISNIVDGIKNNDFELTGFTDDIQILDEQQNNAIKRDFNFVENISLSNAPNELYMNFNVSYLYNLLKTRYMNGSFSDSDEKAFSLLKEYIEDTAKLMSDERFKFNKLHDGLGLEALFTPMDVGNISKSYEKLNELSLTYMQYNKFPNEISPMSIDDLKKRIRYVLNLENADVSFNSGMKNSIRLNGDCSFDAKQGTLHYFGTIDAYTGDIMNLTNSGPESTSSELQPVKDVDENLKAFLKRVYGKDQEFELQYMGVNYNFSSNTDIKVYGYNVYPVIKGLKVDHQIFIYFDARTGDFYSKMPLPGRVYKTPDYDVDTSTNITPEQGLHLLDNEEKGDYSYIENEIIESKLSGKYVSVYEYEGTSGTAYINTVTGKRELKY